MVLKQVFKTLSVLMVLMLTVSMAATKASSVAVAENECEGNACSAVSLSWDNERQQFRVQNDSDRTVKVEVTTFAGNSHIIAPPREVSYLEVKTFNGPYRATYQ